MANLKEVRTRIESVNSTKQITSAMKMVAASKLRKSQNAITALQPYAEKMEEIMMRVSETQTLTLTQTGGRTLIIPVSSNKGLCGVFNANVIRATINHIQEEYKELLDSDKVDILCVGSKVEESLKFKKYPVIGNENELLDNLTYNNVIPFAEKLMRDFEDKKYDKMLIVNNRKNIGDDRMLKSITFKTELGELLTLEEVAVLFDSIKSKSQVEMVSLSIFPKFNQLRDNILKKATNQRNAELSQLLMQIANRKQEIKINMWKTLSLIGNNKKVIQNNPERAEELEQIVYEEEQIIKTYENSIKTLERKEKKIMNGKYSRLDKIKASGRKRTLKKQLVELQEKLLQISVRHDDCFKEYMDDLDELIEKSVITNFPKRLSTFAVENYATNQSITIIEPNDQSEKMHYERKHEQKDYYLYEPDEKNLDDELIYQLLAQGKYDNEGGTINGLSINTEIEEI